MGYYIYAWLEKGRPQLQIVDVETESICVTWSYHDKTDWDHKDKKEIQRLFRDLLLLTCKQELNNCRVFGAKPNEKLRIFDGVSRPKDKTAA